MDSAIQISVVVWLALGLFVLIVNTTFAIGVYIDADEMFKYTNSKTFIVGKGIWAFAALLGGVFVVGIYWLIHYSTLNPNKNSQKVGNNE
jgi:hypothetical protein